jgi:hypothetical protein
LYCNRSFKGDRDPIDDHTDAPLVHMFHPYGRPATEHMDVVVSRNKKGAPRISFDDKDGVSSRRIQSLNRVFRLHKRWPDQLRQQIELVHENVSSIGRRIKRYGSAENITKEVLKSELTEVLEDRRDKIGKRPGYILQTSYLSFALANTDEFEVLYGQFKGLEE